MPYGRPQDYPRGHPERERHEAGLTGDYDFPEGAEGSEAEMAASMMMERGGGLGQFTPSGYQRSVYPRQLQRPFVPYNAQGAWRQREQFGPRLNVDPPPSPQRNNRDRFFRTTPLYSDEIESLPDEIRRFLMS